MDGTRVHYAKRNQWVRERQIPYDLTHMQNLRNTREEHREKEGKNKIKTERVANRKRLI